MQLLLQSLDVGLDPLAVFLGQALEDLRRDHFAALHRREGEADRRAHQGDAARLGVFLDFLQGVLLALLDLLLQDLPARAVFLALEGRAQGVPNVLDEARHVGLENRAAARVELQDARLARLLEVADVAPVERQRLGLGLFLEEAPRDRVLADALGAQRVDVVARPAHADAEAERLDRPLLSHDLGQILEVVGRLEGELFRRAAPAQCIRGQRFDLVHSLRRPLPEKRSNSLSYPGRLH